jgi:hypothetical protein
MAIEGILLCFLVVVRVVFRGRCGNRKRIVVVVAGLKSGRRADGLSGIKFG